MLTYTYFPTKTTYGQHFTSGKCEPFLPVIVVVVKRINTVGHNIVLIEAIEREHQNQWTLAATKFGAHV